MHIYLPNTFRKHLNPDEKSMKTRKRYEGGKRQWKRWEKETKTGIKGEKEGRSSKGEDRACRREDGRARKRTVLHAFAFSVAAAFVPVVFRCLFSAFITLFHIYDPVVADLNENERHEACKTWFPSPFFSMRDTRINDALRLRNTWISKSFKIATLGKRSFIL